jgi:dTDP-L-rhamnose 4-epimerase
MPRDTPYAGVAAIFRSALERGEAPQVTEDGRQLRNFVHVRDVVAANLAAIDRVGPPRAFNVASPQPRSVGDMARALAGAFGAGPDDPHWPVITGRYRLGDVRHVFASTDRASLELGYTGTVEFEAGICSFARAPLRTTTPSAVPS